MKAFADTFAFFACLNPRDSNHDRVVAHMRDFLGLIVTSEWVLTELADGFCKPHQRSRVVQFIHAIRSDEQFRIVGFDRQLYHCGFDLFASRPDKEWSLTDCISFEIMIERGISDALTGDHHFVQAGFRILFP